VSNCRIVGNSAFGDGGGIYNDHSTLTVSNCTIGGNGALGFAGGIYNDGATLTITNSTLSGNSAILDGGAIYSAGTEGSETLTITNSTLSGNSAGGSGGGIASYALGFSAMATLTINNSTLNGNSASAGGGISSTADGNGSTTLAINNSTLSGNSASGYGGGIVNVGVQASATLTINNSTLSGNSASGAGGIYNADNNGAATLTIANSILKTGASGENIVSSFGTVISNGYNLSNDNGGGFLTATGDQINTDPLLGPLQDNGGPTFTHELLTGSPAIDAGDPSFTPPPDYDQRGPGFPRVVNGRIDIGAYEVQEAYAGQVQPPINSDGTSVFNANRGVVPVKFTLTLNGVATCQLPPATIALTRTAGGTIGRIDESVYSGNADTGSNFRIDSCLYVYNLNSRALGVGTYRVDILINGQVVGSAVFGLN
jgi:predicted outer membrane repeat protein